MRSRQVLNRGGGVKVIAAFSAAGDRGAGARVAAVQFFGGLRGSGRSCVSDGEVARNQKMIGEGHHFVETGRV